MNPDIVSKIIAQLDTLRTIEDISIPLAIESGSRAWGFPSPDSDYDCRFIYVRKLDRYLTLFPLRDVLELPMTPVLDINGWDLAKALRLLLKGNAVVIEWLTSPLRYRADEVFRHEMLALADDVVDRQAVLLHYRHLAAGQRDLLFGEGGQARLKKLFYVLRPLMACLWLEDRPDKVVAPMHFPTLCDEVDLPPLVREQISQQLAMKAVSREMGHGPVPAELLDFTIVEMHKPMPSRVKTPLQGEREQAVDAFFRRWVDRNQG